MAATLYDRLVRLGSTRDEALLDAFLEHFMEAGVGLYPAQEEAILELFDGKNVILNTPTGSGKSLVALALHFQSLARGRRSVYTCPIKALVNEKWLALCREFGAENVGLSTGDATVNRNAPILCCTAEILANMALRQGDQLRMDDVVMDEFHYYSDRDRGVAWQVPLLTLSRSRFLLMSATMGGVEFFERELRQRTGREAVTVKSSDRPVPLEFEYATIALAQTVEKLVTERKVPVYVVHFSQMEASQSAQDFTSIPVCSREEKEQLARALDGVRFNTPQGPELKRWLRQGIGVHHAGLLPRYRILVEQLAQRGLLKVICGTDTLGVGINVPIRTVLFTRLCKYDGEKTGILTVRDFHQIAGRAGRKGYDDRGWVIAQAPEHVIENLRLAEKSAKSGKKVVKRKPPEHNFVAWDEKTFHRLIEASPERLVSRFQVTHGMLLNVLGRDGDGCGAMRRLIRECHEPPTTQRALRRRAWQLFRSLLEKGIVTLGEATEHRGHVRVNVDLQEDFSMDQALSLYLVDALPLLDRESPEYPLNLLSLVEAIVEDPDIILRRQLDRLKADKVAELKQEGVEYDERMEQLEKLEHPKPLRDFIYATFNEFVARHPWIGQENIRPKSVVREMMERFRSFVDYIKDYELQRSEGVLLRHVTAVYRVLARTVPDSFKTVEVREMEEYLRTLLRQVDSSLMDEWERMRHPDRELSPDRDAPVQPSSWLPQPDPKALLEERVIQVRARIFAFLSAWRSADPENARLALGLDDNAVDGMGTVWDDARLEALRETFESAHGRLGLDPEARNRRHTHVTGPGPEGGFRVDQMLVGEDGVSGWALTVEWAVETPSGKGEQVLRLQALGEWVKTM